MRSDSGIFVTFEGCEGTGKSTLIRSCFTHLVEREKKLVIKSFEPGGTPFGQEVRKMVLDQEHTAISSRAELFLFLADRAHHVETLIRPALEQGMIVLCDRFNDSSIAYQGAARKLEEQGASQLESVCLFAAGGLVPDLTFYLDLDPELSFKRISGKKDRVEKEGLAFHRRVREGYLELAKKYPERIYTIDASQSREAVLQQALTKLTEVLSAYAAT